MTQIMIRPRGLLAGAMALQRWKLKVKNGVRRAVEREANLCRRTMVEGLKMQAPGGNQIRPLSAMTMQLRRLGKGGDSGKRRGRLGTGSSKALIDSGDLLASINVQDAGQDGMAYTVGVHRGTRGNRGGKDMVDLARVHEYGTGKYTVRVTRKMHKFSKFLVHMGILRVPWREGQILRREVPARPFLRPGYELWREEADERFDREIQRVLSTGGF